MAVVSQCCCGCSLKLGTIMIAVLYLTVSLLQTGFTARSLHNIQHTKDDVSIAIDAFNWKYGNNKEIITKPDMRTDLIVDLVVGIIHSICSVFLLIGAIKEKSDVLLPCVILETAMIIADIVIGSIQCADLISIEEIAFVGYFLLAFLIIGVLISVYFLLVVYSYYQTLLENPPREEERTESI